MADEQATAPTGVGPGPDAAPAAPVVDDPRDARLVLIGAAALVLTLPMPWYRTDVPGHVIHARGWQGPGVGFTLVAVVAALALGATVLGRRARSPWAARPPLTAWWFDGVVGGLPVVCVAARLLWSDDYRSYGLVLALAATAVLAFAGIAGSLARWRSPGRR